MTGIEFVKKYQNFKIKPNTKFKLKINSKEYTLIVDDNYKLFSTEVINNQIVSIELKLSSFLGETVEVISISSPCTYSYNVISREFIYSIVDSLEKAETDFEFQMNKNILSAFIEGVPKAIIKIVKHTDDEEFDEQELKNKIEAFEKALEKENYIYDIDYKESVINLTLYIEDMIEKDFLDEDLLFDDENLGDDDEEYEDE